MASAGAAAAAERDSGVATAVTVIGAEEDWELEDGGGVEVVEDMVVLLVEYSGGVGWGGVLDVAV